MPKHTQIDSMRAFVGSTLVNRLNDRDHAPLRIGSQVWTTDDLASKLRVVHTKAARVLSAAIAEIGPKDVRDLYKRTSPYTFAGIKGLGETTIYVLWRVFESAGLDPVRWAGDRKDEDADISFRSLKIHELNADRHGRSPRRSRQPAREARAVAADEPSQ